MEGGRVAAANRWGGEDEERGGVWIRRWAREERQGERKERGKERGGVWIRRWASEERQEVENERGKERGGPITRTHPSFKLSLQSRW